MTLLQRLIYWISARLLAPIIRRRLSYVAGIEHVPAEGGVVLVANHSSFFDHFLLAAAIDGRRRGRMYFLTKQESFESRLGRLWFGAVGAIPVDRANPRPDTLRAINRVLAEGDVLCVYPEGTRGPGWPLAPFKSGAVRFGLAANVPIIPVGIWGAQAILPKGAWRPRKAEASVTFGPALATHRELSRSERVQAITAEAADRVTEIVIRARTLTASDRRHAAAQTARLVEAQIEAALDDGEPRPETLDRIERLLGIARLTDADERATEIQGLRLAGLRAMQASPLHALRLAWPIRRRAEALLHETPEDPMLRYILGRWHLALPRVLGGRRESAVEHLALADLIAGADTRYAIAHAEALIASGQRTAADEVLARVIQRTDAGPRGRRRIETARALRTESAPTRRGLRAAVRRHPKAVIAAWLIVAAASAPFAASLPSLLKAGGFTNPRGEAAKAAATLDHSFGSNNNALFVVLHTAQGDVRRAIPAALSGIRRQPHLDGVSTYRADPQWLSRDHRTTLIEVGLNVSSTAADNAVDPLRSAVAKAVRGSGVTSAVTGSPALDHDLNVQSQRDVERAEMLAFPVLLIVLALVFQSIAAVLASLSVAVIAIATANAIGYAIAQVTGISILFSNAVSMIGLAVGVDYGLFILKRFREERAAGYAIEEAVDRAMASAGRSVLLSGIAVLVALSTLLIPRVMVLSSIALGAGLVTCVALALTFTFLPAVLVVGGARLSEPTLGPALRRLVRRGGVGRRVRVDRPATPRPQTTSRIERGLRVLYRRPAVLLAVVVAGNIALAFPLAGIRLQVPVASASILPASDQARSALELVKRDLGTQGLFPAQVVLEAPSSTKATTVLTAVRKVTDWAARNPQVATAQSVADVPRAKLVMRALANDPSRVPAAMRPTVRELWTSGHDGTVAQVIVTPVAGPDTVAAHHLVAKLRSTLPRLVGRDVRVQVTGATAQGADFDRALVHAFPLIVGAVAVVTLVLLALAFGSVLLPLVALILNAAVVSASMGVLVRLFQNGHGGSINSVTPVLLFAVTFGLSMDYMVIMLSRIRESFRLGADHRTAVITGVSRTAVMVNGAAAIMVAVFVSFSTAQISIVRELGVGLAVAIALDALVIRLVVMPALLLLIGPRTWGRRGRQTVATRGGDQAEVTDGSGVADEADVLTLV